MKTEKSSAKSLSKEISQLKTRIRTYGPISDLRPYLRPDWWRSLFGPYYLKTDADVVCDDRLTRLEIDRIIQLTGVHTYETILDLCCGQGRHSIELARRGYKYIHGLDRSRYLINKAKAKAAEEGLQIVFREGDARKLPYEPDMFDLVIIMGNSFGYFDSPDEDVLVLEQVKRVLKPSGKFLLDVADGEVVAKTYEPRSWEWINDKLFVCRERMLDEKEHRLICREVVTHVEKGVLVDQVYAERLYSAQQLISLLERLGFKEVCVQDKLQTPSERGQDLGMMSQRLWITAVIEKSWSGIRKRMKKELSVAVILGDPRQRDIVKPNATFDEDDIYTINQLKSALTSIPGYRWVYLDRHERLLNDLLRLRGQIDYVFNLCDEGFNNDPFKELHLPALLEVLGIPYTGSGPQCLAICYDKSMVRGIAREMGIPVPRGLLLMPGVDAIERSLPYPLIVKPNYGDSSFGIFHDSIVENEQMLIRCITRLRNQFGYDKPILLEEFLTGKDLTIGIIGNPPDAYEILPILEEDYSELPPGYPPICAYEAKWQPDSPYGKVKSIRAHLPKQTEEMIVEWSLALAKRLGCRDYVRFDWRLDKEGTPRLLEANPNPGWCWDGHLAKAAAIAGMSYSEMLHAILRAAEQRLGINGNSNGNSSSGKGIFNQHINNDNQLLNHVIEPVKVC